MAASITVARANLAARQRRLREKTKENEQLVGAGIVGAIMGWLEGTGKVPVAVFGTVPIKAAGALGFAVLGANTRGDTSKWCMTASQALSAIYAFEAVKTKKFVAGEYDDEG